VTKRPYSDDQDQDTAGKASESLTDVETGNFSMEALRVRCDRILVFLEVCFIED
jgi:hypothetical protein